MRWRRSVFARKAIPSTGRFMPPEQAIQILFDGYVPVKSGQAPSADLSSISGELMRSPSSAQRHPR
jgi:hypothetical protein